MSLFDNLPEMPVLVDAFKREFHRQEIRSYASSTAYCMLLSVVPLLIIASSILPHTSFTEADMMAFLLMIFPDMSESLIMGIASETYRVSGGVLPVSIVFMLWSAGFGMMQFTKGLNDVNDVREERNYFYLRLMGTLYALLLILLMIAMLCLQVFMRSIVGLWETAVPDVAIPSVLTSALRYIVLFGVAFLVLLLIYTTVPAVKKDLLQQIPGVVVTLVGWAGVNVLFTLYVNHAPNLNAYYGSLTTMVILMLWIYWMLYIMMFGAFVNRYLELHVIPYLFPPEGPAAPEGPLPSLVPEEPLPPTTPVAPPSPTVPEGSDVPAAGIAPAMPSAVSDDAMREVHSGKP